MGRHQGPVAAQITFVQGRAVIQSDRRQLAAVTDDDEFVVDAAADEAYKVVQQVAGAEHAPALARVDRNERGLIHDEEGILGLVEVELELPYTVVHGLLAVDVPVDGRGLFACKARQHLGRTAGRRQQDKAVLQFLERPDERRDGGRLARARVTAHQQQVAGLVLHGEVGQRVEETLLAGRRRIAQVMPEPLGEKLRHSHQARFL